MLGIVSAWGDVYQTFQMSESLPWDCLVSPFLPWVWTLHSKLRPYSHPSWGRLTTLPWAKRTRCSNYASCVQVPLLYCSKSTRRSWTRRGLHFESIRTAKQFYSNDVLERCNPSLTPSIKLESKHRLLIHTNYYDVKGPQSSKSEIGTMPQLLWDHSDTIITRIVGATETICSSGSAPSYISIQIMVTYSLDQLGRIRPTKIIQCVRRHPGIRSHLALLSTHGSVYQATFHWFMMVMAERHIGLT